MNESWNFERYNFRIADVSSLKINERLNVERPNLRESLAISPILIFSLWYELIVTLYFLNFYFLF